jgi:hypothetical protein
VRRPVATFVLALGLVFASSCGSCPESEYAIRRYPFDPALATRFPLDGNGRLSEQACVEVCELLAGHADAEDAALPDAGVPSPAPRATGCIPDGPWVRPRQIECIFGHGCPN